MYGPVLYFLKNPPPRSEQEKQETSVRGCLHETAKIGPMFAVRLILPGLPSDFCKHPTDRHHITQNLIEIYENSYFKIGQRAWQNWMDSLAKSVGCDKNQKCHSSCKRGLTILWDNNIESNCKYLQMRVASEL
jgi:hypothetical protein